VTDSWWWSLAILAVVFAAGMGTPTDDE